MVALGLVTCIESNGEVIQRIIPNYYTGRQGWQTRALKRYGQRMQRPAGDSTAARLRKDAAIKMKRRALKPIIANWSLRSSAGHAVSGACG
jgi:hypothetical protein